MGKRLLEDKRSKEWAAYFKARRDVIRSGWIQYKSDPTNTDFTDYFKKCENFEGMRMHRRTDRGEWVYFNRKWDQLFNKEEVLILRWEIMMIKKKKPIFNVPVIVID